MQYLIDINAFLLRYNSHVLTCIKKLLSSLNAASTAAGVTCIEPAGVLHNFGMGRSSDAGNRVHDFYGFKELFLLDIFGVDVEADFTRKMSLNGHDIARRRTLFEPLMDYIPVLFQFHKALLNLGHPGRFFGGVLEKLTGDSEGTLTNIRQLKHDQVQLATGLMRKTKEAVATGQNKPAVLANVMKNDSGGLGLDLNESELAIIAFGTCRYSISPLELISYLMLKWWISECRRDNGKPAVVDFSETLGRSTATGKRLPRHKKCLWRRSS